MSPIWRPFRPVAGASLLTPSGQQVKARGEPLEPPSAGLLEPLAGRGLGVGWILGRSGFCASWRHLRRGGEGVLGWLPQWGFSWLLSLEEAGGAADWGGNEEAGLNLAILMPSAAV